jgi:hypothetical protein
MKNIYISFEYYEFPVIILTCNGLVHAITNHEMFIN